MKRTSYLVLLILLFNSCNKQTIEDRPPTSCNFTNYRYYWDTKLDLGELSPNYLHLAFDTTYSETDIRNFISSRTVFDQKYPYKLYGRRTAVLKFSSPKSCEEITNIIYNLEKSAIVEFAHYTFKTDNCQSMIMEPMGNVCVNGYNSYFYVNVRDPNNLTDLYKMIAETKTVFVEQDQFMPDWIVLKVTKNSKGNAIQMANYFYESKLFVTADPEINVKFPVE